MDEIRVYNIVLHDNVQQDMYFLMQNVSLIKHYRYRAMLRVQFSVDDGMQRWQKNTALMVECIVDGIVRRR